MDPRTVDAEVLRQVLSQQPEPPSTRVIMLIVSVGFLLAVLNLVRQGRLREEYTPIWTLVGFGIVALSVWFDGLRLITRAVGAWTASSTLFFFGEMFLMVLCLNYAVRLSALTLQMKSLAQEVAMLRAAGAEPRDAASTAGG
jgi:hypothetical protein